MAPVEAPSTFKRFVQVGRVVLIQDGPSAGKLAVIAEVIDHKRALVDGPSTSVPRQSLTFKHMILTPYLLKSLPRAAGSAAIKKQFEASDVVAKWEASAWAKKRSALERRKKSSDFERFEIMLLKKTRRDVVRKAIFAAKKSA